MIKKNISYFRKTTIQKGVKGGWIAVGTLIVGTATTAIADGSELFPSLYLINGEDIIDACGEDIFYKPK